MTEPLPDRSDLEPEHVSNLLLLYLAVAYGADHDFDRDEERAVCSLLTSWVPEASGRFISGMVRTALDLYRSGRALSVDGLALGLRSVLPPALRLQVLLDLSRIAHADGERSRAEAAVIDRVRSIWAAA